MKPVLLALLLACGPIHAAYSSTQSVLVTKEEVALLEERIDRELKSDKLDDKKRLTANLFAGREFYQYRFFDKSKKYYQNATSLNVSENKSEAYINLIAIALVSKDKKEIQKSFDSASAYFNSNVSYKSQEISYYLSSIESYLTGKNADLVQGFYGQFAQEANLVELVKSKKYQEAMLKLNPASLEGDDNLNLETIIYDSLNVSLNKKNVKKLYCMKEYKKYPKAYTYSTLICGLLDDYLETAKFNPDRLKRAKTYFTEDNTEKSYLFDVVKEIR